MVAALIIIGIGLAIPAFAMAGTLGAIRRNLQDRHYTTARPKLALLIQAVESLFYLLGVLALVAFAPHPLTVVSLAVCIGVIFTAAHFRRLEEIRQLNVWLAIGIDSRVPLCEYLEELGSVFRSSIGVRAKKCAARIAAGYSFPDAVRKAKLPVEAALVSRVETPHIAPSGDSIAPVLTPAVTFEELDEEFTTRAWVQQQLAYCLVTPLIAILFGGLLNAFIFPIITEFAADFSEEWGSGTREPLPQAWALQIESAWQWAIFVGRSVLIAIAVWTLVSLLRRWLPQSLVKLIPWFGRSGLDQWKSDVLSQFAAGLQNSRPAADLLATLGRNSRSLSMRNACTFAGRRVENGTDVPAALWHAKLINRQEQSWLNAAAANGNLPSAVAQAAKDIDRRFLSRWRLRMAWVTPLVTVLVSLYTLVFAAYLIGVLSYLVGVCAQ